MKRITIDPITRLEGHGKIEIFLNESGDVERAYLQIPELRGFEKFCVGRPLVELPRITPRICGVCPGPHHMASTKAVDACYKVEPTSAAKKLRKIHYYAHILHSHIAHFYALAAPDFVVGPDADPAKRNILGVIEKVGMEIGGAVIKNRAYAQTIQEMLGGRATHSVCGLPGGISRGFSKDEAEKVKEMAASLLEFGKLGIKIFDDIVLKNKAYVDLILGPTYLIKSHYMGMVDENGHVAYYEGKMRVVDEEGRLLEEFEPSDYVAHIGEHVEPWSYLKFPYLKKLGWKGFRSGMDSGIYRVGPLARLNVANGMSTPLAGAEYEKYFKTLGGKPVHHTLATHWARLIELLNAAELLFELSKDPEITSKDIRNIPTETPGEGVGCVEAPRGTLFHHYKSGPDGITTGVNLLVATGHNNAPINMTVDTAARQLIKKGRYDQGILNMIEMAFRAYDPCYGCATHSIMGQMPMQVNIRRNDGSIIEILTRDGAVRPGTDSGGPTGAVSSNASGAKVRPVFFPAASLVLSL